MKVTKTQLKGLYHRIDNRIIGTINRLGSSEKTPPVVHPDIKIEKDKSYKDLLSAAQKYDIVDFFVFQKPKEKKELPLGYRGVLKGYQLIRDGSLAAAKALYKLRYDR